MAARRNRSPLERVEYALIVSVLVLLVVLCVQPILNLLAISLSDNRHVPGMSGLTIIPQGLSFKVWEILLTNPRVHSGIVNSLLITIVGTAINVVATTLMAWALSRRELPGRRIIFTLVLVTIVFEPGIIPDYFVMKKLGLIGSFWSVIFYQAVNAWFLIVLVRFFEEVPQELVEAAELDGANQLQVFWHVALPLARNAIATVTLFYLVFHWNEFFRALVYLGSPDMWPLQVVLRQFVVEGDKSAIVGTQGMVEYSDAAQLNLRALKAGMILLTIAPILVIYPLILKYFTQGAMVGAVKG